MMAKRAVRQKPAGHGQAVRKVGGKSGKGKADTLAGPAFKAWLEHLQNTGPTWLLPLTILAHQLCCRVTEICRLRLQDFDLENNFVLIGPLKRGEPLRKPLSETARATIQAWIDKGGISIQRSRKWGNQGVKTFADSWKWPTKPEDHLFPPDRSDTKLAHRTKARVRVETPWVISHVGRFD